jgi:hypothetical protein
MQTKPQREESGMMPPFANELTLTLIIAILPVDGVAE